MTRANPSLLLVALLALLLSGCVMIVNRAGERLAAQLGEAVLNSDDPTTVRDGLPAYLLLLDGMIQGQKPGDADNAALLFAAAELNGAYAGNFVGDDAARGRRMARKALDYARSGLCLQERAVCAALDGDIEGFERVAAAAGSKSAPALYAMAAAWAGYLQANRDDWEAIADLPKVEALLLRVVALDPAHARGLPYVYLGVLNSLRPEAVGGRPEQGRAYFERAIALSGGRNLYAKTLMAEFYARLLFDQELHDRLLGDVLAADPHAAGFTLINVLAQQRAAALLESGKDFF